jgi:tRNA(Ile)-lysidine synthase
MSRTISPTQSVPLTVKPAVKLPLNLRIDTTLLRPGLRLAVGLSGGADSVALLRALAERGRELGLVLHAAHLHHGLRGAEADGDLEFCRELAAKLGLAFHEARVETAIEARQNGESGKPAETIEEAARRLRYGWFRQLMASGEVEAVATAHTRDDQAETVLAKFLRGAWTEGLSGIYPEVKNLEEVASPEGRILRPLLGATRAEVEAYLRGLDQDWREDSSNSDPAFTRNRVRHELLPLLETWNPRLREHLAQMAELARDEETWWQGEMARLAPQFLLTGRAVRGGGRAGGTDVDGLAIDVIRLAALAPSVQRRLLRYAAEQLGAAPDFASTEALRTLALSGHSGQRRDLAQGLRAERTARELRLTVGATAEEVISAYRGAIPGTIAAPAFGLHLRIELGGAATAGGANGQGASGAVATLRNWRPGDRVRLRYSSAPRKVKEVLERLRITGSERLSWPVLDVGGRIVWMKGVELEPEGGIDVVAIPLHEDCLLPSAPSEPSGIEISGSGQRRESGRAK